MGTPFGIFGVDQENKIIAKKLFERDIPVSVERLVDLETGKIIPEMEQVINELTQKNYDEIVLEDAKLAKNLQDRTSIVEFPSEAGRVLRSKLISFIKEFNIWKSIIPMNES